MADGKYFLVPIFFFLFVSVLLPEAIGLFVNINDVQISSVAQPIYDFVDDGFTFDFVLFEIDFNIFDIFGSTLKNYILDSIAYLSLLPDWLFLFSLIMPFASLIFAIVALARGN